jgi:hypothetical protein
MVWIVVKVYVLTAVHRLKAYLESRQANETSVKSCEQQSERGFMQHRQVGQERNVCECADLVALNTAQCTLSQSAIDRVSEWSLRSQNALRLFEIIWRN